MSSAERAANVRRLHEELAGFDYHPRTRVVFGPGTLDRVGQLAAELAGQRVLIVTDPGIQRAGHVDPAVASLTAAGLDVTVFAEARENPTARDVDRCVAAARDARIDLLVGLGGGSAMDTAKGTNFLVTNGGVMADYWGLGKATQPMLPMIAIPTTAGTGSEAQSFALIVDDKTHQKMACGDPKAACRAAILDPLVTLSQPSEVTAISGLDAISHALESFVTTRRNPVSRMLSLEAWRLLREGFPRVLADPMDIDARGKALLGAHWAGAAIENSMLGATHAAANPLTARYGVTHGVAIALMLPHVIRYNGPAVEPLYAELVNGAASLSPTETLARHIRSLSRMAGLPSRLKDVGVEREDIAELAANAATQWTGRFNPRPIGAAEFASLYQQALDD
jgi:alcohol dehydrogenase